MQSWLFAVLPTIVVVAACEGVLGGTVAQPVGGAGGDGLGPAVGGSGAQGLGGASVGGSTGGFEPVGGGPGGQGGEQDAGPVDAGLDPDGDVDDDGIVNGDDNCPIDDNPCQKDKDRDGIGDECDPSCEEVCYGTNCAWGVQGCNCGGCPSGFRCVRDTHYEDGTCNDNTFYRVCAEDCHSGDPCTMGGTCIKLFGSPGTCICWTITLTTEPCDV